MTAINPDEPSSSSQPPQLKGEVSPLPHSDRGLDYLSAKIGFMEYGKELWRAVHRLIGRSSLEELIQLPGLLERTAAN
ncbi:hypothetical protein AMTR_s00051p00057470 [Amborella trichopoda]|uniref:Uncharacterized protein n=1 Tax=Amborella trichopoda TaxID=13333 RepID=U5D5C8_AMBTC|nr:hypothetical protein AMTR_s00051p00057470 [Amborella trichopoda]